MVPVCFSQPVLSALRVASSREDREIREKKYTQGNQGKLRENNKKQIASTQRISVGQSMNSFVCGVLKPEHANDIEKWD